MQGDLFKTQWAHEDENPQEVDQEKREGYGKP